MSLIGIRTYWRCSLCDAKDTLLQLVPPADSLPIDPPTGWRVIANTAYCADHVRDGERIAEAEKASGASGLYGRRPIGLESLADYVRRIGRAA